MTHTSLIENNQIKTNKEVEKLYNAKLIVTSIFCLIALTLYLINFLNFPALCLIVLGAIWNFFVDINTFLAFLLSIFVGLLFSMLSIIDGLYANALIYTIFYIPLQFVTWILNPKGKDMSIKKDKKLSKDAIYYICVAFILAFACLSAVIIGIDNEILIFLDAFSACLLGLSAFLQSYMFREFYLVRIVALIVSIVLWSVVLNTLVFSMNAIGMILLYSMYLVVDICSFISWARTRAPYDKEWVEEVNEKAEKKLIHEKVEQYNKLLNELKQNNNDNDIQA